MPVIVLNVEEPEPAPPSNTPRIAPRTPARALEPPTPPEPATPPTASSSVKIAILSAGEEAPAERTPRPFEPQVPLLSDVPEAGAAQLVRPSALEPPDPTRYTTGLSDRPAWLKPRANQERVAATIEQSPRRDAVAADRDLQSAIRIRPERPAPVIEQTVLEQPSIVAPPRKSTITIAPPTETEPATEPAIIEDNDESPSKWLAEAQTKARSAQTHDDLNAVSRLCERVIQDNSRDPLAPFAHKLAAWAHNRRGELFVEANQSAGALAEFQAAIDHDPENSLAIHNRAVTRAQQSDFDAALLDFNRVIELNPGLAIAHRNRAELLAAQGKVDESIADYTSAIEALPEDAELYLARAHAFQQLGQFEPALNDLNRSIRIAPNAAQGYAQRGNLMADRCDYPAALEDFKRALAIDPNLTEALRGFAWIKATCPEDGQRDAFEALAAARTVVEQSLPGDYLALEVLAAAHANAGEFDKAIAVQEQAVSAAPSHVIPPLRARLELYEQRQPYRGGH